ncbi:MAG TPA: hypothetical protein VG409_03425, partial [Actinomycetota bacterium]|nr:hypothetical protein [Actinomycetota bacterium]
SGDVLGGACAALLAAGKSALEAGQLAASLQAVAAAARPGVIPPPELAEVMGRELGRLPRVAEERGTGR